jgi:subtilisin-like proprotein convertase family protein
MTVYKSKSKQRVLHVELVLDVSVEHRGDLQIELMSPANTTARLAEWRSDRGADIKNW